MSSPASHAMSPARLLMCVHLRKASTCCSRGMHVRSELPHGGGVGQERRAEAHSPQWSQSVSSRSSSSAETDAHAVM